LVALVAGVVATAFLLVRAFTSHPTGDSTAPPRLAIDQELSHDFGLAFPR
jgi:hypothetical protein